MNSVRASDKEEIPVQVYEAAGPSTLDAFHYILLSIWENEEMPEDSRDAIIVALYTKKGSKADCGNYRGILLLFIAGKIRVRIFLNRLIIASE